MFRKGFLISSALGSPLHSEDHHQYSHHQNGTENRQKNSSSRVPMMFKMDFTIDSDQNLRI
jgi:hypothetical protein